MARAMALVMTSLGREKPKHVGDQVAYPRSEPLA